MAGGLMQLVAVGAQDLYLSSKPQITFFQSVYKRATPFAIENMEQVINGSQGSNGRVSVTIARNGDLIGPMYLELTLGGTDSSKLDFSSAAASDLAWIAERAVSQIELTIGGQKIDRHYAKWFHLYSELHMDAQEKVKYGRMTTAQSAGDKVFLPLQFFFNRSPGLYLPLIALQYHEVRLDIDLSSDFDKLFDKNMKVWGSYVFLDTEERKRYATKQHEVLIEQVQHTGTDTLSGTAASGTTPANYSNAVRLSYNHPVKELVACFTDGAEAPYVTGESATVIVDATGCPRFDTESGDNTEETVGRLSGEMKLMLNGQDRAKAQGAKYYNQVLPYMYYQGAPQAGIYVYPFALKPGDALQPSGTCNFSRIDNAQLDVSKAAQPTLNLFAVNWNVLRISSGLGGIAFSN